MPLVSNMELRGIKRGKKIGEEIGELRGIECGKEIGAWQNARDFVKTVLHLVREKGRESKVKPPKFKKCKSKQSARFTDNGFTVNQHHITLAKISDLKVIWSRPLNSKPSSVTVIKDAADRYFYRSSDCYFCESLNRRKHKRTKTVKETIKLEICYRRHFSYQWSDLSFQSRKPINLIL